MYLFGIRQFVFMPVPSEIFVRRGRQNAGALFKGLTKRYGARQWVFTKPARNALQLERGRLVLSTDRCWLCRVSSLLCRCDGDKTRKPSRNGVTACFDSW